MAEEADENEPHSTKYVYKECQQIGKAMLNEFIITAESARTYFGAKSTLLENMEDPYAKATNYLERSQVLQLLEELITKLVYKRPDKPIDFLVTEIEEMKTRTQPGLTEDKDSDPL